MISRAFRSVEKSCQLPLTRGRFELVTTAGLARVAENHCALGTRTRQPQLLYFLCAAFVMSSGAETSHNILVSSE
ncbi:MAG: hypothetical protein DME86_11960 [Verrucomicrobia bacterium]|nr:MAG: hypothetical protein DME86_11960 [Verrucomicrobiota bacterium]